MADSDPDPDVDPEPGAIPARPDAPASNRVVYVAAAVLVLTLAAVVTDLRRVRTGELLVQSDDGGVRLTIRRDGLPVIGPTGRRSFTLKPGDYSVVVEGTPPTRRAVPASVRVVRGRKSVVRVEPVEGEDGREIRGEGGGMRKRGDEEGERGRREG